MNFIKKLLASFFVVVFVSMQGQNSSLKYDIVIYGGTSAGIASAIQASRMGKTVLLVEPSSRIGGLTTGGLGQTDIGNKDAIGGISREFYQNIKKYYDNPTNWKWQAAMDYKDGGQTKTEKGEETMWTFEPSAALKVYQDMVEKENITLILNKRLNRDKSIALEDGFIKKIEMEDGSVYEGQMFIDASYEGDLMAAAGVTYTVGRESNDKYGEIYNGVQLLEGHQFPSGLDPYKIPGDPKSGLLWGISSEELQNKGNGDDLVQAYNFRIALTNNQQNKVPISKPSNYDLEKYELLLRLFNAQPKERHLNDYFIWSSMPNKKTDINNKGAFSTDMINCSHNYPEASYKEREAIFQKHLEYTKGLLYFYASNPNVPEVLQKEMLDWGYPKDEYESTGNWSPQLYIREARRMVGKYVMTQANCLDEETIDDSIGLAAYTMDSHNTQRIVVNGEVKNEGNVEKGGFDPYPISYRSIIPSKNEVSNLLVPVCLSASHIAFGSIRMEPVFMVLGQSAATAAVLAIDNDVNIQDIDYSKLKRRLLKDKQRLSPKK